MKPIEVASTVMKTLEAAWNRADGSAYGNVFADDAEFVDIRGELHRGRAAIAAGHQWILDNIYKDSKMQYTVLDARTIAPGVIACHTIANLQTPHGIMDGRHAINTVVVSQNGDAWQVALFHNALADASTPAPS